MLSLLLLIFTSISVIAYPYEKVSARQITRRTLPLNNKISKPLVNNTASSLTPLKAEASTASNILYTGNWAGAILTSPPSNQIYNGATGGITLPKPSIPQQPTNQPLYSASAWVGLDGDTDTNLILQGGVTINIAANGTTFYQGWAEWWPGPISYFTDFMGEAGDTIVIEVGATSTSSGWVYMENASGTWSNNKTVQSPGTAYNLVGQNAEWIVEDWLLNGVGVPLVDFDTVNFTNCSASTNRNQQVGLNEATIINIADFGDLFTSTNALDDASMAISYIQQGAEPLPASAEQLPAVTGLPTIDLTKSGNPN